MFITFEGIEGSGKSTALDRLCVELDRRNRPFLRTREPGGSELGKKLRAFLLDTRSDIVPTAELFLYLADRAQHVERVVRPALEAGAVVLSDRFADSTIVYQGWGRGLPVDTLVRLNDVAVSGLWPDRTLLFDLEPQTGLRRAVERNRSLGLSQAEGRFEAEELAFHQRIREGYLKRAGECPERFRIIDASADADTVFARVLDLLPPPVLCGPPRRP